MHTCIQQEAAILSHIFINLSPGRAHRHTGAQPSERESEIEKGPRDSEAQRKSIMCRMNDSVTLSHQNGNPVFTNFPACVAPIPFLIPITGHPRHRPPGVLHHQRLCIPSDEPTGVLHGPPGVGYGGDERSSATLPEPRATNDYISLCRPGAQGVRPDRQLLQHAGHR